MELAGPCFVSYHVFLKGVANNTVKIFSIAYHSQFIAILLISLHN